LLNKLSGSARLLTASGAVLVAAIGILFLASGPGPSGTGMWWSSNGVQQPTTIPFGPQNGCTKLDDAGSLTCHEVTGWVAPIGVDASGTIWTSPPLAAGERIDQSALLDLQLPGANYAAGNGSARYAWFAIATPQSDGGVLITNALDGGAVSIDYAYGPSLPGSALATVAQCVGDAGKWNAVCEQAYCPLGCSTSANVDYDLRPRAAFAAQVLAISPTSGSTTGGTAVSIVLNGGATGTTSCTLDGVACTGLAAVNDYTIDCTSAAGSAGTGNVACIGGLSVSPLVNGWTYSTYPTPTITNINHWPASSAGGETRCAVGTGYVSGVTTVSVDSASAAVTGTTTSTGICWVMPAFSGTVTSGKSSASVVQICNAATCASTTGTYPSMLWYLPQDSASDNYVVAYTSDSLAFTAGTVTSWVDVSTNAYTMTPINAGGPYSATCGGTSNSIPCAQFPASTTDNRLRSTAFPAITAPSIGEWAVAGRITATPTVTEYMFDLGTTTTDVGATYLLNGSTTINQSQGSGPCAVTPTVNTDFDMLSYFVNGSGSQQILNGGSPVTCSQNDVASTAAIVIGGATTGNNAPGGTNYNFHGNFYDAFWYSHAITTTGRANIHLAFASMGL
jgi:hypothetical protein